MSEDTDSRTVTEAVRSPRFAGAVAGKIDCIVTVPTFRRPDQLARTLASLQAQETRRRIAVIVIENDAEGQAGVAAAAPFFEDGRLEGLVIVAHQRGNCSAYNAGWRTALDVSAEFRHLLVIDDDEVATPGWLEAMCRTAEDLGADIVGGPQVPVFAVPEHRGWADHPVFSPPYRRTGLVPILYSSGNLLVGRHVLDAMEQPFLDLRFNFMGGGDSDFLSRARQKGFRLAWCAQAEIHEAIPARRLEADWIRARSLRNGVISTLVEKKKRAGEPLAGVKVLAKSLALLGVSPVRAARRYMATGSASIALYPVHVGLGRLLAEFGYANEQYRQPENN